MNYLDNLDILEKVIGLTGSILSIILSIYSSPLFALLVILLAVAFVVSRLLKKMTVITEENNELERKLCEVEEFSEEYKKAKEKEIQHSVAIYDPRDLAYAEIRQRAKEKIVLIGTGMSIIREKALDDLKMQSKTVDIEIFMINPYYIKQNIILKKALSVFFDNIQLTNEIYNSYNMIKKMCEETNKANGTDGHKMTLYVYDTLPTIGLTIIDPETENAEIILEPNLYKTKSSQPRFRLVKDSTDKLVFDAVKSTYEKIRNDSKNAEGMEFLKKNGNYKVKNKGEVNGIQSQKQDIKSKG